VRLISPNYVKPFVKRGKSDAHDARAICEAASRPDMRFVPVKTEEQQAALMQHTSSQKHPFRQIQSNRHDRHCKRSPSCFGPIGTIAAGRCGGVHIINLQAGRRPAGMPKPASRLSLALETTSA